MAGFWERCLLRSYHAFAADYWPGREQLAWWIQQVDDLDFWVWPVLSDGALATIASATRENGHLRNQALATLRQRRLKMEDLGRAVRAWQPISVDTWLRCAAMDRTDAEIDFLGRAAAVAQFAAPCARFVSRLLLGDVGAAYDLSSVKVQAAFEDWDFAGSLPCAAVVLQYLLAGLDRSMTPAWPTTPPDWLEKSDPMEREFLQASLFLTASERAILLANVYGGFTARDIGGALSSSWKSVSPGQADQFLRIAWRAVFSQF